MKLKKTIALLLSLVMLLGCAPAMAINVSGESYATDGKATSLVTVDAEPVQMTVTVPSVLPATVDAKGTVTVATDAKVINKSFGPVTVTAIKAEPVSPWQLVGSDYNFAAAKVNSKLVQVSIEGNAAGTDGNVPMNSNWVIFGNGKSHPFDYDIRIPAQRTALADASLSNVVFTVDWYEGGGNAASNTEYSLSLDKDYLAMYPGTAEQVHATTASETMIAMLAAEDADEVAWSTSNSNVASVTDGHVEAKNVGTAVIKAEYHGLTATCVAAVAEIPVPLRAIGFSKNKLTLYKGESETVLLTYNPEKFTGSADVTITPDGDAVTALPTSLAGVTADQGATQVTITANKAGEATITAAATIDGKTITTTMTVEVISKLESLSIEGPDSVAEGEAITLTATKNPSDATGKIVWSSSDPSKATVDQNGVVTGVAEGEVIITAECGGIKANWGVTVESAYKPIEASIDWEYTTDDTTNTITLTKYIGKNLDVVVYNKYLVNGVLYKNVILGESGFDSNSMLSYGPFYSSDKQRDITSVQVTKGVLAPKNLSRIFCGMTNLVTVDISNLDTKDVTNMSDMFCECKKLENLSTSHFNTSNVVDMCRMFEGCSSIKTLDVSGWDVSKVTNMSDMFQSCSSLSSLDLSRWDTGEVTNMYMMFADCGLNTAIDWSDGGVNRGIVLNLSNWDTSKVTDMGGMFSGIRCKSLDLHSWDIRNVISMNKMFKRASINMLDISGWDLNPEITPENPEGLKTTVDEMFYEWNGWGDSSRGTVYVKNWQTKEKLNSVYTTNYGTDVFYVGSPS